MTAAPLKIGFTPDQFTKYCATEVPKRMKAWRPRGVALHNTAMPTLKMVENYISAKKWTFEQLIDNWWVRYIKLGWPSGPHIFVMPDKIWVATPLWVRGTHSPSFNATHWGIELVGDYSTEALPPALRDNAVHAMAVMYGMIGQEPNATNFRFHGEDPRTSHKGCPGKNCYPKSFWDKAIEAKMAEIFPGGDYTHD